MQEKKLMFKRKVPIMRYVFGVAFFFTGIVWLITGDIFGMIFSGISIFFFNRDGAEIDFGSRRYRNFTALFGIHFGRWKDLPEIDYISVFKTTEVSLVRSRSAEATVKSDVIVINLFYHGNHRIKAYTTTDEKEAFSKAKMMAEILNIHILDATQPESKWI